jgi:hypothetical protein
LLLQGRNSKQANNGRRQSLILPHA